MNSRMSKYGEMDNSDNKNNSRVNKNQELYDEMKEKTLYSPVVDISYNQVIFSNKEKTTNRENYQKLKEYRNFDDENEKPNNQEEEKKVYDINQVLEDAKRERKNDPNCSNRSEVNSMYTKLFVDGSKNELEDLINTVTSKKLRKQIDDELLGDLMPEDNTIVTEPINDIDEFESKESEDEKNEIEEEERTEDAKNNDKILLKTNDLKEDEDKEAEEAQDAFFSKTYEVVTTDFEVDEEAKKENESNNKHNNKPKNKKVLKKIMITFIKLIIAGGIVYLVLNKLR